MPTFIVKGGDTLEHIVMRECGDRSRAAQIARDNQLRTCTAFKSVSDWN